MNNASYAAQAVARGPKTLAPPSFDGQGWLVALNLGAMTAGCLIALMVVVTLGTDWFRYRKTDRRLSPAWVWRASIMLFATGIALRCGAEAVTLWGWDPREPEATAAFLTAKRFVDPVAVTCGLSGLFVSVLSLPGMLRQLRRQPFPLDLWQTWPIVQRMMWLAGASMLAAIAVVSLR
ncbi:hypothetical protein SAMN05192583_0538 [Sphingomonas gellani]|uniref:Uncharacterized protein n=1 Tax=Sphingomonas gellani TaxID=1166340 RepID=A0A1H7Z7C2_9SPHN|nr:hypothetical protein [Sphingomonas gellani]SEM53357.1 hypothetical protein SAMN05192583_0538 [Sphingomonas gellani]